MLDQEAPLRDSQITLHDGRTLAYAEYGSPDGHPVMLFHGRPGGRLQFPPAIRAGAAKTRIIPVERPGYGRSDFHTGWGMLDWADDVAALADALDINRFAVVGVSGGGPYAAACAYRLADRVQVVGLVSSPAPLLPDRAGGAQEIDNIAGLDAVAVAARTLSAPEYIAQHEERYRDIPLDAESMLASFADWLPVSSDKQVFARPEVRECVRLILQEGYRQGLTGEGYDSWLEKRPWGFRLEEIHTATLVWHGALDMTVPVENAEYLARTIPDCRATYFPDTGHLYPPEHWDVIWPALVEAKG